MFQFWMQSTSNLKYKSLDEQHLKNIRTQNQRRKESKTLKYWIIIDWVLHFSELIFNGFSWRVCAGHFAFVFCFSISHTASLQLYSGNFWFTQAYFKKILLLSTFILLVQQLHSDYSQWNILKYSVLLFFQFLCLDVLHD